MNPAQAFAAIPLAAICSDGRFAHQEADLLRRQLLPRTPYREMTPLEFAELIDGVLRTLRNDRWESLIKAAVPLLSPEQQETCLALTAQLVMCDDVVAPQEQGVLDLLIEHLELPQGRAAQIVEVFQLLNRDSLASSSIDSHKP